VLAILALSSWTWVVVAAFGLLSFGILIRVTLGLISRLKSLSRTLSEASTEVQDALGTMREELDQVTEHLAALREEQEDGRGRTVR
jgi:hypothetical protein